jgi:hypothetical protein
MCLAYPFTGGTPSVPRFPRSTTLQTTIPEAKKPWRPVCTGTTQGRGRARATPPPQPWAGPLRDLRVRPGLGLKSGIDRVPSGGVPPTRPLPFAMHTPRSTDLGDGRRVGPTSNLDRRKDRSSAHAPHGSNDGLIRKQDSCPKSRKKPSPRPWDAMTLSLLPMSSPPVVVVQPRLRNQVAQAARKRGASQPTTAQLVRYTDATSCHSLRRVGRSDRSAQPTGPSTTRSPRGLSSGFA